jgi:hypothetical protein
MKQRFPQALTPHTLKRRHLEAVLMIPPALTLLAVFNRGEQLDEAQSRKRLLIVSAEYRKECRPSIIELVVST